MEGASLSSQAKPPLFSCWLPFTTPLPPRPCKLKSCGVSVVPAVIRVEQAQAGTSRVVGFAEGLPILSVTLALPPPQTLGKAPTSMLRLWVCSLPGCRAPGWGPEGGRFWIAHPDGHHPEPLNWPWH